MVNVCGKARARFVTSLEEHQTIKPEVLGSITNKILVCS